MQHSSGIAAVMAVGLAIHTVVTLPDRPAAAEGTTTEDTEALGLG